MHMVLSGECWKMKEEQDCMYWIGPQTVGFRRRGDEEETATRQQQKLNRTREMITNENAVVDILAY